MTELTVRWLEEVQPEDIGLVGGKALNLGKMVHASLPVPHGFVITVRGYEAFIEYNAISAAIAESITSLEGHDTHHIEETAGRLRAAFVRGRFPPELSDSVRTAHARLAGDGVNVAVRSSATAEDLADASFAGQHDSYLNIKDQSMLLEAVKKCWASLWSSRAITYRNREGYAHSTVRMAVVVQRMVPARASGILFTANPLTGEREEMVINASLGLGEAIVGGEVIPDTITVDKSTLRIKHIESSARVSHNPREDESTSNKCHPSARMKKISISTEDVDHLSALALQIEALFGTHMDIEWAIQNGSVSILQARRITALPAAPLKWEMPSGLWVHGGGIMEFQREPISPMTSSLIEGFFITLYGEMTPFIRTAASWPAVRVVNGHLYSCLTYRVRPWHLPRVVQLVVQHLRSVSRWPFEREAYLARVGQLAERDLTLLTSAEIIASVAEAMRAFFRYYLNYASMVQLLTNAEERFSSNYRKTVMAEGDPEPAFFLQGLESKITSAEDSLRALADELRASPFLYGAVADAHESMEPPNQPAKETLVRGFQNRVRDHIATYGHQMYAFDFNIPTLGERPELIYEAILSASTEPNDPKARRLVTQQRQELALRNIQGRLSRTKWRRFERLLNEARRNLAVKENAVFEIGRGIPIARAGFLELGTRLVARKVVNEAPDVFWLSWEELQTLAQDLDATGTAQSQVDLVVERRARWARFEGIDAPTFLPRGQKPNWWLSRIMPLPELDRESQGDEIRGVAVSPGVVEGTARVVVDISDMSRIRQGEILVTDATTPAWTLIFGRIGGLVTNRGGKLTHSSIVAREYGIPVVMGTVVATKELEDGQTITVDGNRGIVRILPSPHAPESAETLRPQ